MISNPSQLFVALLLVQPSVSQITIGIADERNFCLMMPPKEGDNVGNTEGTSVARCMGNVPGAKPVGALPDGFITSAHLVEVPGHVQITGTFDRTKFKLSATDGGGQYDDALHGSRPGSTCANYPHYLEYLEPDQGIFCVRCCTDGDCDISQDTIGCRARMGGNYGPGFTSSRSASSNNGTVPVSSNSPAPSSRPLSTSTSASLTAASSGESSQTASATATVAAVTVASLSTSTIANPTSQVTSGAFPAGHPVLTVSMVAIASTVTVLGMASFALLM